MIAKKSSSADLEKKRFAFFQIGLIVSGALCLVAFEYSSAHVDGKVAKVDEEVLESYVFDERLHDIPEKPMPQRENTATVIATPIDNVTISSRPLPNGTSTAGFITVIGDTGYEFGEIEEEDVVYEGVDKEPAFPGGVKAMMEFIQEKTEYPELEREMGIQGIVYVEFIVNKDGSISSVLSKSELNKNLEKEAMRVVGIMPNWIPGEQAGKAVRVRYIIPINFSILP